MTDLERLLAEHACMKLQAQYGVFADRGDVEGFTNLFAPDGSVAVPEAPAFVGHDAIRASIQALGAMEVTMRHVLTNNVVEVTGPDTATGVSYLTVWNSTAPADDSGQRPIALPATMGEYADTFRRTPEGWRFQSRVLTRVFRGG
jgi:ketosteroid isomerase-like protein